MGHEQEVDWHISSPTIPLAAGGRLQVETRVRIDVPQASDLSSLGCVVPASEQAAKKQKHMRTPHEGKHGGGKRLMYMSACTGRQRSQHVRPTGVRGKRAAEEEL